MVLTIQLKSMYSRRIWRWNTATLWYRPHGCGRIARTGTFSLLRVPRWDGVNLTHPDKPLSLFPLRWAIDSAGVRSALSGLSLPLKLFKLRRKEVYFHFIAWAQRQPMIFFSFVVMTISAWCIVKKRINEYQNHIIIIIIMFNHLFYKIHDLKLDISYQRIR